MRRFFVYFLLTVAATVIGKTARNTLFLARFEADALPWMYMGIAAVMALLLPAYGRLGRSIRSPWLGVGAGTVFALGSLVFVPFDRDLAYGAFYVWVEVGTAVLFFDYWMLAGQEFSAREAKRFFGLIGSGAGLANLLVGLGLGPAVARFGTGLLVPATALAALGSVIAARSIVAASEQEAATRTSAPTRRRGDSTGTAGSEDVRTYLRWLAVAGAASVIVFTIVDYQFKAVAAQQYDPVDLATFFGRMYALTGVGALATQLLLTRRVLTRLGVGAGLLVLPITQLVGALALLWRPWLAAAVFLRGSDRSFRFTIDQASRQILWLPLDAATQRRSKPVIDESVRHAAVGGAGVLILMAGGGVRLMSVLALPFLGLWLLSSRRLARMYVDRLQEAIVRYEPVFEPLQVDGGDADAIELLRRSLPGADEEEALYLLDLIDDAGTGALHGEVRELYARSSAIVRQRIVEMASVESTLPGDRDLLKAAADVEYPALAAAAVRVCAGRGGPAMRQALRGALRSPLPAVRVAAAQGLIARCAPESEDYAAAEKVVRAALEAGDEATRASAASVLLGLDASCLETRRALLTDPSGAVRSAALDALAERPDPRLLPEVIPNTGRPGSSAAATRAVAAHGGYGQTALLEWLERSGSGSRAAYRALAVVMDRPADERGASNAAAVSRLLGRERAAAERSLQLHSELRPDSGAELWVEHVRSGLSRHLDILCCLATAVVPGRGLARHASRLHNGHAATVADVLEHLDNVLPRQVASWMVPLLEELARVARRPRVGKGGTVAEPCGQTHPRDSPNVREALAALEESTDDWERMLALHLHRCRNPEAPGDPDMLNRLETTLFLRKVDLFAGLDGHQVAVLAERVEEVVLAAGETLFAEGDPGDALYVVRSGVVELSREGRTLAALERGGCFGEFAVLDGLPRTATASAARDTRLLELARDEFLAMVASHPAVLEGVLRVLTERIRELVAREGRSGRPGAIGQA